MNNLLVISYNEGEQDFYKNDIENFCEKVSEINPSVIIVCTQKSKSQVLLALPGKSMLTDSDSTKHFPHVFGKYLLSTKYKLLYKKDASFMIRGLTENNNVRTRIYINTNTEPTITNIKCKLSTNTIGQVSKMSVNRQAIYIEMNYSGKKIIVLNTELADYTNGNLGVCDRQKEFMSLIKEFELHKKYNEGYNIIFSGSLNFKLNPIKMINNEYKSVLYNKLEEYIEKKYKNNTLRNNLFQINELKVYLDKLINKIINEENNQEIINMIDKNIYNKMKKTNELYLTLLSEFSNSITQSGIKLTCDYNLVSKNYRTFHPLKLGSVSKNIVKSFNSAHGEYNSTKTEVITGFGKGLYKGTTSILSSAVKPITSQKTNYKLPSMCDRILFALSTKDPLVFNEFNVYEDLKKSKHRLVYSIFSFE
jgi:hypothetical protein